jgi:peptide/nickel transport system permease protein
MTAYIIRRILWGIVLLFLISALTFLFFYVFPAANPAVLRAGRNASPHTIAYISKELGLDEPVYTQFYDYMKGINLHFNFGYHYSGTSVLSLIFNRLPATLSLTVGAVVLWVVVGIPIGIISAIKRGKFLTARRWEPRSSSCRCPCSGSGCCCCSCSLRTSVGFRSCRAQAHTSD